MNARGLNLVLLAICLGLAGTLVFTLWLLRAASERPSSMEPQTEVVTNTVKETKIAVRKINASNFLAALAKRALSWRDIESTNYYEYVENLRAFGCPEETIRDIILTDVAKVYARQREEQLAGAQYRYWEPLSEAGQPYGEIPPESRQALMSLDQQRDQLVRDLLGVDFESEMLKYWGGEQERVGWKLTFLSPEKREEVMAIRRKYEVLERALHEATAGAMSPEDLEQLGQLRRQEDQELAGLLTPEELRDYALRFSPEADVLRIQMSGFNPSEQEFRTVFQLQQSYEQILADAFASNQTLSPGVKQVAEEEASRILERELQEKLGPARYQEYLRSQDGDYRQLLTVTSRMGLPESVANQAFEMRGQALDQLNQLQVNPSLTPEQRERAVLALASETEKSLAGLLGERPFRTYRTLGGEWLDALRVIPEPPPPEPELPPAPNGFPQGFPLSPVPY